MAEAIKHIDAVKAALTKALKEEWEAQGHKMTGSIVDEIEYVVKEEAAHLEISGYMAFYGNIIAAGTPSDKIPYSGRTGRGGTSKYITALQNYVKQRMRITEEKKSKSIAFAIAANQKKYGMPTPGSYSFSKSGKRRDWIEEAFRNKAGAITEAIRAMSFEILTIQMDVLIKKFQIELNKPA